MQNLPRNHWFIYLTLALAFLFNAWPLSHDVQLWRPPLISVLVIYWVFALPQRLGLFFSCITGLILDVLYSVPLGVNVVGLGLATYFVLVSHQRVRNFSVLQQSSVVFLLLGVQHMVLNWVHAWEGRTTSSLMIVWVALLGALLWPLLSRYLDLIRRRLPVE